MSLFSRRERTHERPQHFVQNAKPTLPGQTMLKRIRRQCRPRPTLSNERGTGRAVASIRSTFSGVFRSKIVDENATPTVEQQVGLRAYESLISDNPDACVGTLLHFAVTRSDNQLLKYALDHGLRQHGNMHHRDCIGRMPIDVALQRGHIPCIETLISRGADIDLTSFLKSCSRQNRVSTIDRVLRSRNLAPYISLTQLQKMFEISLSFASVGAVRAIANSERFHAMVSAGGLEYVYSLAALLLLDNQTMWQNHRRDLESVLDSLILLGLDLDRRWLSSSQVQESWLHAMADSACVYSISAALDRGANVNALDSELHTPLMRTIARAAVCENQLSALDQIMEVMNILLGNHASLNAGKSVWSMKSSTGFWILFDQLVVRAPSVNYVDEHGLTLLHYAVDKLNHAGLEQLLPRCSLVLNHCSLVRGTALNIACQNRDWDSVLKLVQAGAQSNLDDIKAILTSPKQRRPCLLRTLDYTPFLFQQDDITGKDVQKWVSLLIEDVLWNCDQASDLKTLDRLSSWLPVWVKDGQDLAAVLSMHTSFLKSEWQLQACKILLTNKTNPNAYTKEPRPLTLLEYAVKHRLFDCAIALLEAGADPNQSQCTQTLVLDWTLLLAVRGPLHARRAAAEFAEKLRQQGANQRQPDPGPALVVNLMACLPEAPQVSTTTDQPVYHKPTLTSSRSDAELKTPISDTIEQLMFTSNHLHRAIRRQDLQGVYHALSQGIDPNIPTPVTNEYPVSMALMADSSSILTMLLSGDFEHMFATPSPNGTLCRATGIVEPHGAEHPSLSWPTGHANQWMASCLPSHTTTYLIEAALRNSVSCVKVLLNAGANVNVRAQGRRTVLHHLILARPSSYLEIAEITAQYGSDIFAEEGVHCLTPVHLAVYGRDVKLLEALLNPFKHVYHEKDRLSNPKFFSCGFSPLDLARQLRFESGVQLLDQVWRSTGTG